MKENKLNDSNHVFVIAEAGSNWKCGTYEEDIEQSKKLIKAAAIAGADAVKFQTYKPETIYSFNAGKSNYLAKTGINENINELFEYLSMPYEMIPILSEICKNEDILFMSTPFSVADAKEIDPFVDIHKVASFEINHIRLLEFLAQTKKPMIISTGASTFDEIDFAVNLVKAKTSFSLLQCTSKYPCEINALNLSVLPKMKSRYNVSVGLSDHSIDPIIGPKVAVGLGATIIEKHFTLDKSLPGPDHSFALTPKDLKLMIDSIRNTEKALGTGEKIVLDDEHKKALGTGEKIVLEEEQELHRFAKRSIQAIKDIHKGDILEEGVNFEILRPGNRIKGISPQFLHQIIGKHSLENVIKGDGISLLEE